MRDKNVQYLCARIRGQWIGIDVNNVIEITSPGSKSLSAFVENTRSFRYNGQDIKAVNLTELLVDDNVRYDQSCKVLISETNGEVVGLVVDSADEIIRTTDDMVLRQLENSQSVIGKDLLDGLLRDDERQIHILAIDRVLNRLTITH